MKHMPCVVDEQTAARLQQMIEQSKREITGADAKASALLGWSGTVFALITGFLAFGVLPAATRAGRDVATAHRQPALGLAATAGITR